VKNKGPYSGRPFLPELSPPGPKVRASDQNTEIRPLAAKEVYKRIWGGSLPEPVVDKKMENIK
jgi:hypothetical protein